MRDRPALPPARHWPDRPETIGGLDVAAGGTWMALNDAGVFATLLNGKQSLGPVHGKRSRGELPLDALDFEAAADAAEALATLDPTAYRPFNLLIADATAVFLLQNDGAADIRQQRVSPGVHMISHSDLNDPSDPRVRQFGHAFAQATAPHDPAIPPHDRGSNHDEGPDHDKSLSHDKSLGHDKSLDHHGSPNHAQTLDRGQDASRLDTWALWVSLLASRQGEDPHNPLTALTIKTNFGFETRSAALIGVRGDGPNVWWHRDGQTEAENLSQFHKVDL